MIRERDRELGWSWEDTLLQGLQSSVGGIKDGHHYFSSSTHPSPLKFQGFTVLIGGWSTVLTKMDISTTMNAMHTMN